MAKISSFILIVVALLDCGLCVLDVACKRQQLAPYGSEEAENTVCHIDKFSVSMPRLETYNFRVNYARPDEIEELHFAPSMGVYKSDHAIEFAYIPTEIFTKFPNLANLRMSTNLTELNTDDFTQAMNLAKLNLQDNNLRIIKTNVFTKMSQNANEIPKTSDDSVFPLHKLRELKLFHNNISEIEANSFNGLRNLVELLLQYNKLTVIRQDSFAALPSLGYLVMHNNKIDTIEDGALDLPALRRLELGNNKLKRLPDFAFDRLPNLEYIALYQNDMEHIGQSLYRLSTIREIRLGWNQIEDIDLIAFALMSNMKVLDLTHSGFTFATIKIDDEQHWNASLTDLHINTNNLADATELNKLRIFTNLEYLGISVNSFTNLEVGGNRTLKDIMPSMKMLNISNNKMSCDYLLELEEKLKAQGIKIVSGGGSHLCKRDETMKYRGGKH